MVESPAAVVETDVDLRSVAQDRTQVQSRAAELGMEVEVEHARPKLPERLVAGRERIYFDWFLDLFAVAYRTPEALATGFDWYRSLPEDAEQNSTDTGTVQTPVLYLRGDADPVDVESYLRGFRHADLRDVEAAVVPHSGHSASLDSPYEPWAVIRDLTA